MSKPVLQFEGVSKSYGHIQALDDVSFSLNAGEVIGLVGDNGAGKSTTIKMIAGNFTPTKGTLKVEDTPVRFHNPNEARAQGVEVVYQDLALCNHMSAASNVFLGREPHKKFGPLSLIDYDHMRDKSAELFDILGSETRPAEKVKNMSGGQRQAVAIARAMLSQPKIMLMDEPTAAVSVKQVARILDLVRNLKDQGMGIIYISHRLPDVFEVADRMIVLRRGRKVADKPTKKTSLEEITGLITGAIDTA